MTIADLIVQHPYQFWFWSILLFSAVSDIGSRK